MRRFGLVLVAAALACLVSTAWAADPEKKGDRKGGKRQSVEQQFNEMDKDGNKSLSLDEFKANPRFQRDEKAKERAPKMFAEWDKDNDGKLTLDEYKAGREEMMKKYRDKKGDKKEK